MMRSGDVFCVPSKDAIYGPYLLTSFLMWSGCSENTSFAFSFIFLCRQTEMIFAVRRIMCN